MSVHIYNEGDHPGQFQGIRVVRKVGGILKQEYFPFKRNGKYITLAEEKRLLTRAEELDRQWEQEQKACRQRLDTEAQRQRWHESPFNTGVRGISARFLVDKRFRAGRYVRYYTPAFRVHGQHNHERFVKAFRITTLGYEKAWAEAVRFYAKNKELRTWAHLRRKMPHPDIFREVRAYMNMQGHEISAAKLPVIQ